jgi:trehalose 6-phosphate synthase
MGSAPVPTAELEEEEPLTTTDVGDASMTSSIVIVANRLPVHRVRRRSKTVWQTSPGGLVSALKPVLEGDTSTWLGWSGIAGKPPQPFEHDGIRNHAVRLARDEVENYYEGFCNRTLWPLYHDAVRTPEYHRRWWSPYVQVNRRFAEAAAGLVAESGTVWVHDYHLQLVPAMLRELRPDVRIGFFLHIPFPPQELFAQLPWRRVILEGLLGADVVGFQTAGGALNFARLARRYTTAQGKDRALDYDGRVVRPAAFPVSIDAARFEGLARSDLVRQRAEAFRRRLGPTRKVMLGVDRLDYTKGIDIRLDAYRELLSAQSAGLEDCVLVQVAVPSRERVTEYREMRASIERLVGEINGQFGELGRMPIHYLHRTLPLQELVALYRAADVMLVTPLRDGMNLVAKEYVVSRYDDTGALVLSEFTGAARELGSALLVNPHDIDDLTMALDIALHLPPAEQRERMQSLRRSVMRHDVFDWAKSFLEALGA